MTVNIWKPYNYVHCSWRNKYGNHPCSYEHCLTSSWNKTWKKFRPERDLKPWSLRYRWSALSSEITSQLRAGHYVVSDRPSMWWAMTVNIWKLYMCSAVDETNVEIIPALMNTTELLNYWEQIQRVAWWRAWTWDHPFNQTQRPWSLGHTASTRCFNNLLYKKSFKLN